MFRAIEHVSKTGCNQITVLIVYRNRIRIRKQKRQVIDCVDGRSVLSLLSLAAACGTQLVVRAVGSDAEKAVEALGDLIESPPA